VEVVIMANEIPAGQALWLKSVSLGISAHYAFDDLANPNGMADAEYEVYLEAYAAAEAKHERCRAESREALLAAERLGWQQAVDEAAHRRKYGML
jgi:hypothetical protein